MMTKEEFINRTTGFATRPALEREIGALYDELTTVQIPDRYERCAPTGATHWLINGVVTSIDMWMDYSHQYLTVSNYDTMSRVLGAIPLLQSPPSEIEAHGRTYVLKGEK